MSFKKLKFSFYSGMKQEMKNINKEIKLVYRSRGEQSKYKYKRLQTGVWLSSFIGLFMPCCYTKPIEAPFISSLTMNVDILRKLGRKTIFMPGLV